MPLTPGREWSLTELAYRAGPSLSSAQRDMARAEQAGVISSRRLGSTRLVTAADSPLTGPLTELLLREVDDAAQQAGSGARDVNVTIRSR